MKNQTDPRHSARRVALSSLFCWMFSEPNIGACTTLSTELLELPEQEYDVELTNKIIEGIKTHVIEIDDVIQTCAPEWPIDKIAKVDLIILRIAIYEIMFEDNTPDKVIIDEAVELAKEFGGETASKFVNGVLGTVVDIKKGLDSDTEKQESEND
jgi:transcription antitermination protein NusB